MTDQQRHSQFTLQQPDLRTERRLGKLQGCGGSRDIAGLYGSDKILQLAEIDARTLSSSTLAEAP
jgi:hypothetical protein